jgi:hypothetical protein
MFHSEEFGKDLGSFMSLDLWSFSTTIAVVVDQRGVYMQYLYMVYSVINTVTLNAIPMHHLNEFFFYRAAP